MSESTEHYKILDDEHESSQGGSNTTFEKVAMAAIAEQRSARRWGIGIRVAWLLLAITSMVLIGINHDSSESPATGIHHTAVVKIQGEIASGADSSAEFVLPSLKRAFEDKGADAVVLLINSPGGSPVQAGIINDEIFRLKALHKKPVYAVAEETCASAAYYIASAADEIFVDKASVIGSIGVLMDGFGFTGLMEKLGVERRLLTAGENKGFLDPFSPQSDKQREITLTMLDKIHQQFIAAVKKGRGDRIKESPDVFSGLFWTGQQAIELGLADQLGSVDSVARDVVKAEKIIDYSYKKNPVDALVKRFGASIGEAAIGAMKSSGSIK